MEDVLFVFASWQFIGIGVIVALAMMMLGRLGARLWKVKKLRRMLQVLDCILPHLPMVLGAALGAIPVLPKPGILEQVPGGWGYAAMIGLGFLAGVGYERIWKGVKHAAEAAGVKLDLDEPPAEQRKRKR